MEQNRKKVFRVEIAKDECKGCERCVITCPRGLLKMGTKFNIMSFPYAVYSGSGCIGCGSCFYTCPEPGAITIIEEQPEENTKDDGIQQ